MLPSRHTPVLAKDTVRWMRDSIARYGEISNQHLSLPVGVLPTVEGENIGVAMVIRLLAMSIMTTNRSRRNSITAATNTNTSYE